MKKEFQTDEERKKLAKKVENALVIKAIAPIIVKLANEGDPTQHKVGTHTEWEDKEGSNFNDE